MFVKEYLNTCQKLVIILPSMNCKIHLDTSECLEPLKTIHSERLQNAKGIYVCLFLHPEAKFKDEVYWNQSILAFY